jgi:hypothetical protein
MAYPLEALLRPAHELRSACVSALGAGVVIGAPDANYFERKDRRSSAGYINFSLAARGS